jgi:predicted nucleic acid-binding protein
MTDSNFIYWDSSIWLSNFLQDQDFPYAEQQLERIKNGSEVIVVSNLVLMEVIGVLRQRTIEKQTYQGITEKQKAGLKKLADDEVTRALMIIRDLGRSKKVIITSSKMSVSELHQKTYDILACWIFGDILPTNKRCKCPSCGVIRSPTTYRLKYPGHYDIQHALLANEPISGNLRINEIVSVDRAFTQLHTLKDFQNMVIRTPPVAT